MSELEHPRVDIRHVADIDRLSVQLFTRWTIPRVDIHVDSLPEVAVQQAQHRFAQGADASNGGLGIVLASTTAVVGICMAWASIHSMIWTPKQTLERLALIAVAAIYAGLLGKAISVIAQRVRLLRVLRGLRRRMVAGSAAEPARYAGRVPHDASMTPPAAFKDDGGVAGEEDLAVRSVLSRPGRPKVLVHDTADVKRLLRHLLTHWKLPRVQINVNGVATLDVQRAQHRIVRLSETCHCVLGASLAGATLLGGSFAVEWVSARNWAWWVPESWGPLALVPVAALCAALFGVAIEMVWTRVKLMQLVRTVRHRLV